MDELLLTDKDRVQLWGFSGGPQFYVRLSYDFGSRYRGRKRYVAVYDKQGRGRAGVGLYIRKRRKPERQALAFYARSIGEGLDMIVEYLAK